ncbi:hypothetical protein BDV25DRAFT_52341 [Aspergillus avenaceus]|uniref:Zn(2)-C6 fungal-type domain-containing protein n=1 Tax=Aspergillus avenaceus TaxID=36643 RepID=A0A5N6TJ04_ASPAV|nr:hypothetical protein BDV25DRAFT_52341 [Aspergillus avenaceus]
MQAVQYERHHAPGSPVYADHASQEPRKNPVPKNVAFELLLDENSKVRARIPMRVQIYPHDTTDSIVTTVKNFYGIYDGAASGVSFEDENGITLIARYENLRNNMTVYVRVIPVQAYTEGYGERYYMPVETRKRPSLGEPFQMAMQSAQIPEHGQPPSRPGSRLARKRSVSPSARSRRSASQHKQLPRAGNKSRGSSTHGSFHDDGASGYSDSEGGYGSVSGAKKPRSEQLGSSDISMDNILQDGRRKRPKFESSELPLFVPPQVPLTTSTSSISPQRRSVGQEGAVSPFARPTQRPYNYQQPLPSPQSYGHNDQAYGYNSMRNNIYATPVVPEHGHRLRDRTTTQSSGQFSNPSGNGNGVLPTPDPTIASCISDEDVAMQLIRLGDASNFSHGRTSASTLDDAFSGAADAASSTGATSDDGEEFSEEDDDLPARSRQRLDSSPMLPPGATKRTHKRLDDILPSFDSSDGSDGDEEYQQDDFHDHVIKNEADDDSLYRESAPKPKKAKTRANSTTSSKVRGPKSASVRQHKTNKSATTVARKVKSTPAVTSQKTVMAPQMLSPAPTRKASTSSVNFQHQLAADEEDLSTKPRCQRCRKSKKGCDRQRPCGRCKDAGIGLEGCISEDEGNGRKGRYGRHMGVPVKKTLETSPIGHEAQPVVAAAPLSSAGIDKNKKRKR